MMAKDRATRTAWVALPVLLAGLLASGCYNPDEVKAFLQKPRSPVSGVEYRVLPPDMISISSTRVPEVDGFRGQIRPDGKINLPLLGEVYVADKTPKEIEEAVKDAAKKYYEEVDAAVQVAVYNSRRFYVFGQVSRPGPVPWTGCDTLLDVLATAQPTPLAWPERIIVIRGAGPTQGGYAARPSLRYQALGVNEFGDDGPAKQSAGADPNTQAGTEGAGKPQAETAPGGQADEGKLVEAEAQGRRGPQKMTVNLMAMVQHGDMANNILLRPNDIIYVQANPFAKTGQVVEQLFMPVRAATDGLYDYRELLGHWKWIEDGMHVSDQAAGTQNRLIAR